LSEQSQNSGRAITATAGINIALVKYWGKRDAVANLPAVGSISLTVDALGTETRVEFVDGLENDLFELDGEIREDPRVIRLLDSVRTIANETRRARIQSRNDVPTGSGLASSASGVAALATAAWAAAGLSPESAVDHAGFLDLVRIGSGSAPRSLLGGLVELDKETTQVEQLLAPEAWDLCMVVARLTREGKAVSSREGMARTAETSPYYQSWVDTHPADLEEARLAIADRDLQRLGETMERSTHRMHACMLGAKPPLRYWRGLTLSVADAVESLRRMGIGAWYTMDAGPHVKILCAGGHETDVVEALNVIVPREDLIVVRPGPGARIISPC
jgi:diphosphomevalonate decarboxylase